MKAAIRDLRGSADHLFKIWLTFKRMGLDIDRPAIVVDTANSTTALEFLFGGALSSGEFFVPFARTPRFMTIKSDASRSIIQTTAQRWASSGSVVTVDPSDYIDFRPTTDGDISVRPGRRYPLGLGHGKNGFAPDEDLRLSVPIHALAAWIGRTTPIPDDADGADFLVNAMLDDLSITAQERDLVFCNDDLPLSFQGAVLSRDELNTICRAQLDDKSEPVVEMHRESFTEYSRRVRRMSPDLEKPQWLRRNPEDGLGALVEQGHRAILLYGPPRSGKTRLVDRMWPRANANRITIQIHDGWSYEHLIQGMKPGGEGDWDWVDGPLKSAIESGVEIIVLEEANRTALSQALGEVFSLIETAYRGKQNAIVLRNGEPFWIPEETTILFTMNTVDRSTEDIDDALLGRVALLECPASGSALQAMLTEMGVDEEDRTSILELYGEILTVYPLGHGYFADLPQPLDGGGVLTHYVSRIRPVLQIALGDSHADELANIDNLVDQLFAH